MLYFVFFSQELFPSPYNSDKILLGIYEAQKAHLHYNIRIVLQKSAGYQVSQLCRYNNFTQLWTNLNGCLFHMVSFWKSAVSKYAEVTFLMLSIESDCIQHSYAINMVRVWKRHLTSLSSIKSSIGCQTAQ